MFKRALIAAPIVGIGIAALAACSPSATTPVAAPTTTTPSVLTTTAPSAPAPTTTSTTPATNATPAADNGCKVNPATAAMPTADPYMAVPKADQVQVSIGSVPATVRVAGAPVEIDVTVCNNSPVAYPQAAFVFALDRGTSAPGELHIPDGTVQRFDNGQWVTQQYPHVSNDVGYLGQFADAQPLPKGKAVTIRYRITYAANNVNGTGSVVAAVVTPKADAPLVLGTAKAAYTVAK
jgi:hypothetical protein